MRTSVSLLGKSHKKEVGLDYLVEQVGLGDTLFIARMSFWRPKAAAAIARALVTRLAIVLADDHRQPDSKTGQYPRADEEDE